MARLNEHISEDSDDCHDEFPDLDVLLGTNFKTSTSVNRDLYHKSDGKENTQSNKTWSIGRLKSPTIETKREQRRQIKHVPLGSLSSKHLSVKELEQTSPAKGLAGFQLKTNDLRRSPKRAAKSQVDYQKSAPVESDSSLSESHDENSSTDLSGFIVSDSVSDTDEPEIRNRYTWRDKSNISPKKSKKHSPIKNAAVLFKVEPRGTKSKSSFEKNWERNQSSSCLDDQEQSRSIEEPFSRLKFSPPRYKKPSSRDHHETPPSSPSKSLLLSPSKRHRIPQSPHRASIDAFWSQDLINEWNDQYSPKKPPKTPSRKGLSSVHEDSDCNPPTDSPRKSPMKSPAKRDKELIARRKDFNEKKTKMATDFLTELDDRIAGGQVTALAASTGGIQILWSKKLSSTAGRANWRRETLRRKSPIESEGSADGGPNIPTHRHHASIELAEKVIDDAERLVNVLAHEYCHLATFMIDGIKDQPHGPAFKAWAAKCTRAFGTSHGVEVTTKHAYNITYKYAWLCTNGDCGTEYQRHSRSIDPEKHGCGKCKGRLEQVRPAPRKESEYQKFIKANFETVRQEIGKARNGGIGTGGVPMGDVMAELARRFKAQKTTTTATTKTTKTKEIADPGSRGCKVMESERSQVPSSSATSKSPSATANATKHSDGESDSAGADTSNEFDDVARKLNFLSLDI